MLDVKELDMSSYMKRALKLCSDLPDLSKETMERIEELDDVSKSLSERMDQLIAEMAKNPSKFPKKSLEELKTMRQLLEDLAERKAQLAVRNYDFIDQQVHLVDHELRVLESVMRCSNPTGYSEHLAVSEGALAGLGGAAHQSKKGGRGGEGNLDRGIIDSFEPIDPNEPVYCICRQIAYGDMIACDNEECAVEWFHYSCVNLKSKPLKSWFCPTCVIIRRQSKKEGAPS